MYGETFGNQILKWLLFVDPTRKTEFKESLNKGFDDCKTASGKPYLKEIRKLYAKAMRAERSYYRRWREEAALDPTAKFSMITDGASSNYLKGVEFQVHCICYYWAIFVANFYFIPYRVQKDSTGTVVCQFRQFRSDLFNHIVFCKNEFSFWNPTVPLPQEFPTVITIKSQWEEHSVLMRYPDQR
jgi:hypothetical protein